MSPQFTPGRIMLSVVALMTSTGCWVADYSDTHIFNPLWMPHAVFHCGQTIGLGTCLGLSTLYYTWSEGSPGSSSKTQSQKDQDTVAATKERLNMATWLASMYWITQLTAWCFPNSAALDPPADPWQFPFPQFYVSVVLLSLTALGRWLEGQRIARIEATLKPVKGA